MAEQLAILESGKIQEEILKQMNILKVRKEIGCLLLTNSGMQTIFRMLAKTHAYGYNIL